MHQPLIIFLMYNSPLPLYHFLIMCWLSYKKCLKNVHDAKKVKFHQILTTFISRNQQLVSFTAWKLIRLNVRASPYSYTLRSLYNLKEYYVNKKWAQTKNAAFVRGAKCISISGGWGPCRSTVTSLMSPRFRSGDTLKA